MSRLEEIQALVDEWRAVLDEANVSSPRERGNQLLLLLAEEMVEQERMRELVQKLVDQVNDMPSAGKAFTQVPGVRLDDQEAWYQEAWIQRTAREPLPRGSATAMDHRRFIPNYGSEGDY